jgi:hypothetical protein
MFIDWAEGRITMKVAVIGERGAESVGPARARLQDFAAHEEQAGFMIVDGDDLDVFEWEVPYLRFVAGMALRIVLCACDVAPGAAGALAKVLQGSDGVILDRVSGVLRAELEPQLTRAYLVTVGALPEPDGRVPATIAAIRSCVEHRRVELRHALSHDALPS